MEETPYQTGYRHGKNGEPSQIDDYKTKHEFAAYSLGYAYGEEDKK